MGSRVAAVDSGVRVNPSLIYSSASTDDYPAEGANRHLLSAVDSVGAIDDLGFKYRQGDIPFFLPNVRPDHEVEDLNNFINGKGQLALQRGKEAEDYTSWFYCLVCSLVCPIIGCCYASWNNYVIYQGEFGFSNRNGAVKLHLPGRHFLLNPVHSFLRKEDQGQQCIHVNPVTIVRIVEGTYGLATNNSKIEVLLPGVHVRLSAAFNFLRSQSMDEDRIELGPLKMFTIRSGEVGVCFNQGKVQIFHEGRYAVNNVAFRVSNIINTQQQNLKFSKHLVLLDGGIALLIEGLLTYKIIDVEKLIKELGERDLKRCIEDITKAEISRAFSGVHLEQISSSAAVNQSALLGEAPSVGGENEGEERSKLCAQIIVFITPLCSSWGVKIINFQLESTKIADQQYASEYEQASLQMAKAKANLRSVDTEVEIALRRAAAKKESMQLEAEGKRAATVILAEGEAGARKIEASARNAAALAMKDNWGRKYAKAAQQVEFANALQAEQLTVIAESGIGKAVLPLLSNNMQ